MSRCPLTTRKSRNRKIDSTITEMTTIRQYTLSALMLALAWSCSKTESPGGSHVPGTNSDIPITWNVAEVERPHNGTRSLVGPETDGEGNPYPDRSFRTMQ